MVVDHLTAESRSKNTGVACVYLSHAEAEDQTPAKLLSSLWRQLVYGKDIGSLARKLYQQHQEKCTTATVQEAFEVLCPVIADFSKVYIVIDAVDEYQETQWQILLEYLAMLGPTVNIMIMTRPHVLLDPALPDPSTLEIRANEDDIRTFVDAQIYRSLYLKRHVQAQPNLLEEIHFAITRTVDGM